MAFATSALLLGTKVVAWWLVPGCFCFSGLSVCISYSSSFFVSFLIPKETNRKKDILLENWPPRSEDGEMWRKHEQEKVPIHICFSHTFSAPASYIHVSYILFCSIDSPLFLCLLHIFPNSSEIYGQYPVAHQ